MIEITFNLERTQFDRVTIKGQNAKEIAKKLQHIHKSIGLNWTTDDQGVRVIVVANEDTSMEMDTETHINELAEMEDDIKIVMPEFRGECALCEAAIPTSEDVHVHNNRIIGDCCWDERLKTTEAQ